jgi:hypothetical protein
MRMSLSRARGAVLAVAVATATLVSFSGISFADPAIDPALAALNKVSREAYAAGRDALLSRTSPVIVVEFDDLLLLRDGKETRAPFTPPVYHALKSVAHLPLGIYGVLAPAASGVAPGGDWRLSLQKMREAAVAVAARAEQMGFDAAQLSRTRRLIEESIGFIDQTAAAGTISEASLRAYARRVAPLTLANASDAARAQVDGLHHAFERLKADMSERELAELYVLVLGSKTPRAGNLQYEYFVNALGRDAADRRVIYVEGVFDRERALGVLATLIIDRRVGRDFYGEEGRMERDLLGDGAEARLLQIFGRLGAD